MVAIKQQTQRGAETYGKLGFIRAELIVLGATAGIGGQVFRIGKAEKLYMVFAYFKIRLESDVFNYGRILLL